MIWLIVAGILVALVLLVVLSLCRAAADADAMIRETLRERALEHQRGEDGWNG